jgi:hypothetical protein
VDTEATTVTGTASRNETTRWKYWMNSRICLIVQERLRTSSIIIRTRAVWAASQLTPSVKEVSCVVLERVEFIL